MRASPQPSLAPRSRVPSTRTPRRRVAWVPSLTRRSLVAPLGALAVVALGAACVPPGNAVPEDSGPSPKASAAAVFAPSIGIMT